MKRLLLLLLCLVGLTLHPSFAGASSITSNYGKIVDGNTDSSVSIGTSGTPAYLNFSNTVTQLNALMSGYSSDTSLSYIGLTLNFYNGSTFLSSQSMNITIGTKVQYSISLPTGTTKVEFDYHELSSSGYGYVTIYEVVDQNVSNGTGSSSGTSSTTGNQMTFAFGSLIDWDFFWSMFQNFLYSAMPFALVPAAVIAVGLLLRVIISAVRAASNRG